MIEGLKTCGDGRHGIRARHATALRRVIVREFHHSTSVGHISGFGDVVMHGLFRGPGYRQGSFRFPGR